MSERDNIPVADAVWEEWMRVWEEQTYHHAPGVRAEVLKMLAESCASLAAAYEDDGEDETGDPQCKYCGRYPGLHAETPEESVDTSLVDPQWDGDGDVCADCFEELQGNADVDEHDSDRYYREQFYGEEE